MTRDNIKYIKDKDPQTLNLYEYAGNDPVSNTDFFGKSDTSYLCPNDYQGDPGECQLVSLSQDPTFIALSSFTGEGETEESVNFSIKALERMWNPDRFVPVQTLMDCIKYGAPEADPQGSRAILYSIEMFKNNEAYQLEVLYDQATNTIWHFVYKSI